MTKTIKDLQAILHAKREAYYEARRTEIEAKAEYSKALTDFDEVVELESELKKQ